MDKPTSTKLEVIVPAFRMHSQLFYNVLKGLEEADALKRVNNLTNHVVWMAGNLVNCRYMIADLLGLDDKDPYNELFSEGRSLDERLPYPTLEQLKNSFATVSANVYHELLSASDDLLAKPAPFGMNIPFVEENVLNMIGMCIGREDYLLGQMGLMRKLLGLKGMSYDINTDLDY